MKRKEKVCRGQGTRNNTSEANKTKLAGRKRKGREHEGGGQGSMGPTFEANKKARIWNERKEKNNNGGRIQESARSIRETMRQGDETKGKELAKGRKGKETDTKAPPPLHPLHVPAICVYIYIYIYIFVYLLYLFSFLHLLKIYICILHETTLFTL